MDSLAWPSPGSCASCGYTPTALGFLPARMFCVPAGISLGQGHSCYCLSFQKFQSWWSRSGLRPAKGAESRLLSRVWTMASRSWVGRQSSASSSRSPQPEVTDPRPCHHPAVVTVQLHGDSQNEPKVSDSNISSAVLAPCLPFAFTYTFQNLPNELTDNFPEERTAWPRPRSHLYACMLVT